MPNLTTSASLNGGSISLTFEDDNGNTETVNVGGGSNTYTLSNISSGTSQIRIQNGVISGAAQLHSVEVSDFVSVPSAPQNVSATVDANDQITLSWDAPSDWGGEAGNYHVQINRDGNGYVDPSGGTTQPGSGATVATYGPSSDSSYDSQVGIDSKIRFRIRAENSAGNSGWSYSDYVYTKPVPPRNINVSRPDASTIQINGIVGSDIGEWVRVSIREDTGSGYGSWSWFDNILSSDDGLSGSVGTKGDSFTISYNIGQTYQSGWALKEDARYQIRLATGVSATNSNDGDTHSGSDYPQGDWVFADYGNEGNVYFEDDFESGDASNWTELQVTDSQYTYVGTSMEGPSGGADTVGGTGQGNYSLIMSNGDWIRQDLGDLSNESNVLVKAYLQGASLDNSSETIDVEWYDGSNWIQLESYGWEYNRQGWFEMTTLVPNDRLSSNNQVRFKCGFSGYGDHMLVDRVVVSDILHEYTTPTGPTSPSLDTTTEGEITASWTNNHTFADDVETWFGRTSESLNGVNRDPTMTSYTFTDLDDGEEYEFQVNVAVHQYRNGSRNTEWDSNRTSSITGITALPAPEFEAELI